MSDMDRFKLERPEWADIPDEYVEKSLQYQAWALGEAFRELGRELADALYIPQLVDWVDRKIRKDHS